MNGLMEFLMFALPGGFLGSLFTWLVGRRKRDNDMLSQLQASINMLSEENRKALQENVQLRVENAQLKANQEEMLHKLSVLTREVERLRKVINRKTNERNKNISAVVNAAPADSLRGSEDVGVRAYLRHDVGIGQGFDRNGGRYDRQSVTDEPGGDGASASDGYDAESGAAVGGESDTESGEPP